jgi:hypothetical protein
MQRVLQPQMRGKLRLTHGRVLHPLKEGKRDLHLPGWGKQCLIELSMQGKPGLTHSYEG